MRWYSNKSAKRANKFIYQKGFFSNDKSTLVMGDLILIKPEEEKSFNCNCNNLSLWYKYFSPIIAGE